MKEGSVKKPDDPAEYAGGQSSKNIPADAGEPDRENSRADAGGPDRENSRADAGEPDRENSRADAGEPDRETSRADAGEPDRENSRADAGGPGTESVCPVREAGPESCGGKPERRGKVYLVGAGPSDPGLLTLKGRQVLREAETVVYDALVGAGILAMIPETAEVIYVGKRSGHHTLPQEEISAILARKAGEGKRVVRLKGGDPFLFGRGGEEIETLLKEGIPFEIVPGVTSALAVPAYQGIPVTHRDCCSSLHIITGHKRAGGCGDIDFEALVRTKGTLVFLMGVTALGDICRGLLKAGIEADMPAALLMRGTTARQRKVLATVSTLEEEVKKAGACTPAIIVVGRVCQLSDQFGWYEKLPLGGARILLTRPQDRIGGTAAALRREGAEVLELPTIRTVPAAGNPQLEKALRDIRGYNWIVFTSQAGVRCFFDAMAVRRMDRRALAFAKFAVIGPGTARELEKYGIYAEVMPEIYDAMHLGRAVRAACIYGDRILIPRAEKGSPELLLGLAGISPEKSGADTAAPENAVPAGDSQNDLRAGTSRPAGGRSAEDADLTEDTAGEDSLTGTLEPSGICPCSAEGGNRTKGFLQIDDIPVYDTVYEKSRFADLREEFMSGAIDYALFTSASTVRGFVQAAPGLDYRLVRAVCIGKQTAAAAEAFGMQIFVAGEATIESLIRRVKELWKQSRQTALQ